MVFLKPKVKKKLTRQEEFDIMKIVMDKFMWLSIVLIGIGIYNMVLAQIYNGAWFLGIGVVLMILFMIVTIQEYEWIR
ncbi:hypothetical protein ACFL1H_03910 [Nanoarchaeota archaeon]